MQRYRLLINADDETGQASISLDAPSVPVALLVADINMDGGTAEIWDGGRRLARMRKRTGAHQSFWEVT